MIVNKKVRKVTKIVMIVNKKVRIVRIYTRIVSIVTRTVRIVTMIGTYQSSSFPPTSFLLGHLKKERIKTRV